MKGIHKCISELWTLPFESSLVDGWATMNWEVPEQEGSKVPYMKVE